MLGVVKLHDLLGDDWFEGLTSVRRRVWQAECGQGNSHRKGMVIWVGCILVLPWCAEVELLFLLVDYSL